jgi:hypothetical protein
LQRVWALQRITDELGEDSQATEGPASEEDSDEDTEAWPGVDDEEFDVKQLSPSAKREAKGRLREYDIIDGFSNGE